MGDAKNAHIYFEKQGEERLLVRQWRRWDDDIEINPKEVKVYDNVTLGWIRPYLFGDTSEGTDGSAWMETLTTDH